MANRIVHLLLLVLLQAQSVGQIPGTVHCTPIVLLLLKLGSQGCVEGPELCLSSIYAGVGLHQS